MPSTLRSLTRPILVALVLVTTLPASLRAQELGAQTSVAVRISVRPSVVIRSVATAIVRAESRSRVATSSVVAVESNLPYQLAVRLSPSSATFGRRDAVRILVRRADGEFEAVVPGQSVVAAVSPAGGQRGHEVVCRVEAPDPELLDAGRCALVFELSAEYQDTMVRTTATHTGSRSPRRPPA